MSIGETKGPLFVVAAAVLWGTAGAAVELGPPEAAIWQIAFIRLFAGGIVLAAIGGATALLPMRPAGGWLTLLAGGALAGFQFGYFTAISRLGVALGTIVAIGTGPVLAGAVQRIVLGLSPEARWWPATAIAVSGLVVLLSPGTEAMADYSGVGAGVGAGVAFAVFAVASRGVLAAGVDPALTMGWLLGVAAVLLAPLALTLAVVTGDRLSWIPTAEGVIMLVWLVVGATVLAYWLFGRGLASVQASSAATLVLIEPLTAASLGVGLLRERPGVVEGIGGLLLLAGLALLSVPWAAGGKAWRRTKP